MIKNKYLYSITKLPKEFRNLKIIKIEKKKVRRRTQVSDLDSGLGRFLKENAETEKLVATESTEQSRD